MAFMHQCDLFVQRLPLESLCLSSSLPILHAELFEEDPKGSLDVIGWNSLMHTCSEAMFADLGHFSSC